MIAILSTKGYTRPVKIPFMKFRCLHDFRLCALAALVLGTAARGEDVLLPIAEHRELELSCASQPGHTYQIQFSDNLIDWDFLNENRQFGGDGYLDTHVPITGSGKFFRYFIAAQPPGGLAPWSVSLRNWVLNVQGHPQILHFTSPTTGTLSAGNVSSPPVTFAYSVLRTGENLLRVQMDLPEGVHRTLEMNFLSLSQGEWGALRDLRLRSLGEAGERWVSEVERLELEAVGRSDLAAQIEWTAKERGDGFGYDIASFEPDGTPIQIEVKTTNLGQKAPFYVTRNEVTRSVELAPTYRLYRVFEFARSPRVFIVPGSVERSFDIAPMVYQANLR